MSLLIYRERHPQTVEVERVVEVEVLPKAKLRWDEPAEGSAETGQPDYAALLTAMDDLVESDDYETQTNLPRFEAQRQRIELFAPQSVREAVHRWESAYRADRWDNMREFHEQVAPRDPRSDGTRPTDLGILVVARSLARESRAHGGISRAALGARPQTK